MAAPFNPLRWGIDILHRDGNFHVGAGGDVALAAGGDCLVQDIMHLLQTPKGGDWRDPEIGNDLFLYIQSDVDESTLLAMAIACEECVEQDPRVEPGATDALATWDPASEEVVIHLEIQAVEGENPLNLVLHLDLRAADLSVEVLRGR